MNLNYKRRSLASPLRALIRHSMELRFAAEGITTVTTWSPIRAEALKNRLLLAIRATT